MAEKTSLLKAGSLLFAGSMAGNLCNYLFQIIMGRWLTLEDYGIMNSLFSLFMITTVPALTITTVMAKYTSNFKASESLEKVSGIYYGILKLILICVSLGFLVFLALSPHISAYLKIPTVMPTIMMGVALCVAFMVPINLGVLQGFQHFGFLGIAAGMGGVFKLIFSVGLVYMGFKVSGVMAGLGLAAVALFLITFLYIRKNGDIMPFSEAKLIKVDDKQGIFKYSLPVLLATILISILTQVDMVLVKHYFSAQEAGLYASAAVLGRVVLYLPAAVVFALFPMVAELHTLNQDTYHILNKGLVYTGLLAGGVVAFFWAGPEFVLGMLFGEKFMSAAPLLGLFGLAMFPLALLGILINFNLARHQVKFLYPLLLGTIIQVGLIYLYHQSLTQVLWIMTGMGTVILTLNLGMVFWEKKVSPARVAGEIN